MEVRIAADLEPAIDPKDRPALRARIKLGFEAGRPMSALRHRRSGPAAARGTMLGRGVSAYRVGLEAENRKPIVHRASGFGDLPGILRWRNRLKAGQDLVTDLFEGAVSPRVLSIDNAIFQLPVVSFKATPKSAIALYTSVSPIPVMHRGTGQSRAPRAQRLTQEISRLKSSR